MGTAPGNHLTPHRPGHSTAVQQRDEAPKEVWHVWLREGDYGDTELAAARLTREGAASWCNEHRKLLNGTPIRWQGDHGTSTAMLDRGRHGRIRAVTLSTRCR